MTDFRYNSWLSQNRQRVENNLVCLLPTKDNTPDTLCEAIQYAVLDGGKRLRAMLCLATCEMCGGDLDQAAVVACAIEMIHAYSLVHDDLPCMDDDILRRGKPTCHVRYGQAVALLVGDALLTQAFTVLSDHLPQVTPEIRCQLIGLLAESAGAQGMVGGQYLDISSAGKTLDIDQLKKLHQGKTGALIRASVLSGALITQTSAQQLTDLDKLAQSLGLLYQVVDDILDVESQTETLGKTAGKDALQDKSTYVTLLGLDQAKAQRDQLCDQALLHISAYPAQSQALRHLIAQISSRDS